MAFVELQSNFLKKLFPEGEAFVLGPITADHWLVFVADYLDRPTEKCVDRTLDVCFLSCSRTLATRAARVLHQRSTCTLCPRIPACVCR